MDKVRFLRKPKFHQPRLLVGWEPDAGALGAGIITYLRQELKVEEFCRLSPLGYFPLGAVSIENDVVEFPTPTLYFSEKSNLILFHSTQPAQAQYEFLSLLLDLAEEFKVRRIYTVGGLVSRIGHLERRRVLAVFNRPELREELSYHSLSFVSYHGSTSMNGFLLWLAKRRDLRAVSLWGEVPFYLANREDPRMMEVMLKSLCQVLDLQVDLSRCRQRAEEQERRIAEIRRQSPRIDDYLEKVEKGLELTEEESLTLVREMEDLLREAY